MALTRRSERRNGWEHQAEYPAPISALNARWRTLDLAVSRSDAEQSDLTDELEATRAKLANRTSALDRAEQRISLLTKRVAQLEGRDQEAPADPYKPNGPPAEKWISALEDELSLKREELIFRENENLSLRASLELTVDENARLSEVLLESNAEIDIARPQLEAMKAMLRRLEAECGKLAIAADKADERRRAETSALKVKLDDVSSQAAKDKLLAEVWRNMLARNEQGSLTVAEVLNLFRHLTEKDSAIHQARSRLDSTKEMLDKAQTERKALVTALQETTERHQAEISVMNTRLEVMSSRAVAAEAMIAKARTSLAEKLELIQISFRLKEEELWLLRQSRLKLIEDASTLLTVAETNAKARADARAKTSAKIRDTAPTCAEERFESTAEQSVDTGGRLPDAEQIDGSRSQPRDKHTGNRIAGEFAEWPQTYSAVTLLAETIAF
ncbi:MAG TPA: hypothetical protein VH206_09015 [Xanthobacteraceae bacterium]|jgi:uncharacterized coiled-coil protein SlyX|nr:hypothetical protein [Xanthobacteraceae bacterium]